MAVASFAALSVNAVELVGPVVGVTSGDTLVVRYGEQNVEVRLADIGAPRHSQYYAPAARTLLASLALDKIAEVTVTGTTSPDRVFGRVTVGKLDVNLELVRQGAAWVCWEYAHDTGYRPHESAAKRVKRGLWAQTWEVDARADCRRRPPAEGPVSKS